MWGPTKEDIRAFKWMAIIAFAAVVSIAFLLGAWLF